MLRPCCAAPLQVLSDLKFALLFLLAAISSWAAAFFLLFQHDSPEVSLCHP